MPRPVGVAATPAAPVVRATSAAVPGPSALMGDGGEGYHALVSGRRRGGEGGGQSRGSQRWLGWGWRLEEAVDGWVGGREISGKKIT